MSRKHFVEMAQQLTGIVDMRARRIAAEAFCAVAIQANTKFNKGRFMSACGL